MKFRNGDAGKRVIIHANAAEGWEEERGVLLDVSGNNCVMVRVDGAPSADDPDGLREAHFDDVDFETV